MATISLSISSMAKKDDYYIVNITASGLSSSSGCFVQGMFTATPSSYFGYTWSSKGEWLKYDASPDQEFVKANFVELINDEPKNILVKPDFASGSYKGPGNYILKVRRFIANGNSSSYYSNIIPVDLTEPTPIETVTETPADTPAETPMPTLTVSSTSTPTLTPTSTKTLTPTPTKTPTKTPTISKTPTPKPTTPSLVSSGSGVLGESTDSASVSSMILDTPEATPSPQEKPTNYKTPFFIGLTLVFGGSLLLYFRHRRD